MKKRVAFSLVDFHKKHGYNVSAEHRCRIKSEPVFYGFEDKGVVSTDSGVMILGKFINSDKLEFAMPDLDVIAKVGVATSTLTRADEVFNKSCDLYWYRGKYYLRAVDCLGIYYFHSGCALLYEIDVVGAVVPILVGA